MELKDTIEMMNSADYKERFKAEYYQLEIRTNKLADFITKYENGRLNFEPSTPIRVLRTQYDIMLDYLATLDTRASIEHIQL